MRCVMWKKCRRWSWPSTSGAGELAALSVMWSVVRNASKAFAKPVSAGNSSGYNVGELL